MLSKKITTAAVLASALTFTAQSQAAEVNLNTYVGALLSNAVTAVQQEIQYGVQEAVLNATHSISLSEEAVEANISINEIAKSEVVNTESDAKA